MTDFFDHLPGPGRPAGRLGAPRGPHGPHGPRLRGEGPDPRGGRRGRAARGDVRTAVLLLLDEGPMHGYQLMQAIAERSRGTWQPSPGAIYPLLGQLEDEGLITVSAEGGRRLARLTEAGRAAVAAGRGTWSDPFAGQHGAAGSDLRPLLAQLHDAARQVARAGGDAEVAAAAKILTDARRALYLLLAGEEETSDA